MLLNEVFEFILHQTIKLLLPWSTTLISPHLLMNICSLEVKMILEICLTFAKCFTLWTLASIVTRLFCTLQIDSRNPILELYHCNKVLKSPELTYPSTPINFPAFFKGLIKGGYIYWFLCFWYCFTIFSSFFLWLWIKIHFLCYLRRGSMFIQGYCFC